MARIKLALPGDLVARRATASGRKGATRWEIFDGDPKPIDAPDHDANWLGDIVRFVPEYEYCWQPKDGPEQVFDNIEEALNAIPLPDAP